MERGGDVLEDLDDGEQMLAFALEPATRASSAEGRVMA